MNIKKKIFYILNAINDGSQITEPGEYIKVGRYDKQNKFFEEIGNTQLEGILKFLEQERIVRVIKEAEQFHVGTAVLSGFESGRDIFRFYFLKDKNFDKYFNRIKEEISYVQNDIDDDSEIIFKLDYEDISRQISIIDFEFNKRYLLSRPNDDTENRVIFEYLFKYSKEKTVRKEVFKEEIKKELNKTMAIALDKAAAQLGFNRDLKKVFFSTSKKTARLRIKISKKDLEKLNIDLRQILKKLNLKITDI